MKLSDYIETLYIRNSGFQEKEFCSFITKDFTSYYNVIYFDDKCKKVFKRKRSDFNKTSKYSFNYNTLPFNTDNKFLT